MATAMYLEHYLDSIENLPCELQRNFQLMRELDQRTEDKKAEIDILAAEYISTVKTLSPDQRVERLQKIQNAYSKCKEYSDDKVQLAMQTYEMVDKHIRRLDADLARFEADLKDKMEGSDFESSGGRGLKKGRGQKEKRGSRGRGRRTSEEDTPKKKKHKGGGNSVLSLPAPSCSEPEGPVPTVPFLRESGTPPGLFLTQCCFSRPSNLASALEPGDAETRVKCQLKMSGRALWTELDSAQKRRASESVSGTVGSRGCCPALRG
uniref:Inhibitor of growth family member 5 n=1 Tax=Pongo abelii TaxID=9601 RepID=A0A8I5TQ70_PONAB